MTNSRLVHLEVTPTEVENRLKTINVNKAKGPDGIPGRLLKECAKEISSSLAKLFNKSLRVGMVPKDWKLANIIPLFKNGTKGHLENYRPISLLSLVSKILVRCVLKRLLVAIPRVYMYVYVYGVCVCVYVYVYVLCVYVCALLAAIERVTCIGSSNSELSGITIFSEYVLASLHNLSLSIIEIDCFVLLMSY